MHGFTFSEKFSMSGNVQQAVLSDASPMRVADYLLRVRWSGEQGQRLWRVQGQWWEWRQIGESGRWVVVDEEYVRSQMYEVLDGAEIVSVNAKGVERREEYQPDKHKIDYAMDAMKGLVRMPSDRWPRWTGEPKTDEQFSVAFEDVVVDVRETARMRARGEQGWKTVPRTEEWFSPSVVPRKFDPEAKCPVFDQCMREWHDGDQVAIELRDRVMGACMMSFRGWSRFLNDFGKARGGKGSPMRLMSKMLGREWVKGVIQDELVGKFGVQGLWRAKVLWVDEARRLDEDRGGRFSTLLKIALAQTPAQFGVKYREDVEATLGWFVVVQGNDPLVAPNSNRGLSSKMLALGYRRSWAGRERLALDEELEGEMGGVALRWILAALRLVASDAGARWVLPKCGEEVVREFETEASGLFGRFLAECFVEREDGWVHNGEVLKRRREWEKENEEFVDGNRRRMGDRAWMRELLRKAQWDLRQGRKLMGGEERRCVLGMGVRV